MSKFEPNHLLKFFNPLIAPEDREFFSGERSLLAYSKYRERLPHYALAHLDRFSARGDLFEFTVDYPNKSELERKLEEFEHFIKSAGAPAFDKIFYPAYVEYLAELEKAVALDSLSKKFAREATKSVSTLASEIAIILSVNNSYINNIQELYSFNIANKQIALNLITEIQAIANGEENLMPLSIELKNMLALTLRTLDEINSDELAQIEILAEDIFPIAPVKDSVANAQNALFNLEVELL